MNPQPSSPSSAAAADGRAWRWLTVWGILVASIGLDQLTKRVATLALSDVPPRSYLHDLFRLEYARNQGAFLSLGGDLSASLRFWIFTVAVAVMMLALLGYALEGPRLDRLHRTSYALMVSGGVSNWWDRLQAGRVTDFMNLGVGSLRTGIFNVADLAIVAGVVLLFFAPRFGRAAATRSGEVTP